MSFTQKQLAETASELRTEIHRFLAKSAEPDVLLGMHPIVVFASQRQSIAIWHGQRIENHLADWINGVPDWTARPRERITINGTTHEIDNLAWNSQLDIVLAVEAKRVWANQDHASKNDVRRKNAVYMDRSVTPSITSHVGQPNSDFRHFVFDVYGDTQKGSNGLPIISGDNISHVFAPTLASYVEWERCVIANAILEAIDPEYRDLDREQVLSEAILNASPIRSGTSKHAVIDYIDAHAS